MWYRFGFLCLAFLVPYVQSVFQKSGGADTGILSYIKRPFVIVHDKEKALLDYFPNSRFSFLDYIAPQSIDLYEEKLVSYLKSRGVSEERCLENFAHEDLLHIAQALSILFEQESDTVLQDFLGEQYFLVEGCNTSIPK